MCRRLVLTLGFFGFVALVAVPAWATTPAEILRAAVEEVTQILEDPSLKPQAYARERQARVRAVVFDLIDFADISRRALGRHWRTLSPSEREEFVPLFRDFLEHTYLPKIALYKGERVRFSGEAVDGDLATVQTLVITRQGTEIPVAYRLVQRTGNWRIVDISVEGISFTANYRAQFDQIIQRGSYQELVRRLKQKLAAPPEATPPGVERFIRPSR